MWSRVVQLHACTNTGSRTASVDAAIALRYDGKGGTARRQDHS